MAKADEISRIAAERLRAITERDENLMFGAAQGTLRDFQQDLQKKINLERALAEEEGIADFIIDLNRKLEKTGEMTEELGLQHIEDVGNALIEEQSQISEVLGETYLLKQKKIIDDTKLRFLANQKSKEGHTITLNSAKKTLDKIVKTANSQYPEILDGSLDTLHKSFTEYFGEESADVLISNTKNAIQLRQRISEDGKHTPIFQPKILTTGDNAVPLNTHLDTKIIPLLQANPMLARGFFRIHDITAFEAMALADKIESEYPDSPEPEAIRAALNLRNKALLKNPLQYGSDQLYYHISSQPINAINFENDHRFNAAHDAFLLFDRTNFFTEEEKIQMKSMDPYTKSKIFNLALEKLDVYNRKIKRDKIPVHFLKQEISEIDPDAATWVEVYNSNPKKFKNVNLNDVLTTLRNYKAINVRTKVMIQSQLYNVPNIGSFVEMADVAESIASGKDLKIKNTGEYFTTSESFAFLNKYANGGASFQDTAQKLLASDKKIKLRNIDVDMFMAYTSDGMPYIVPKDIELPDGTVIKAGHTAQFLGQFLDSVQKNADIKNTVKKKEKPNTKNDTPK